LPAGKADAIDHACALIAKDRLYLDQFVVDAVQGGAGTSTNMNANEVVANLALEFLGHQPGEYQFLHPIDDVNMAQSTNDAYPTALRLAVIFATAPLARRCKSLPMRSRPRRSNSPMCSRSAAPSCRTRCL
jgi:aspartate ammonia-lyase